METPNNILNVDGEQDPAAGASASLTAASTASTAAVRQQELYYMLPPKYHTPAGVRQQ